MPDFHAIVSQVAAEVRRRLRDADLSDMRLDIEISGRAQTGDLKIEYKLGDQYAGADNVAGARLGPVVEEYLRRKGWSAVNAPTAISYVEPPAPVADSDIPF